MKILVLGCGPAGLLVTHACILQGHEVRVVSRKLPSHIAGAQFLHSPIPELTNSRPDGVVRFAHFGSEKGYAEKIYGEDAKDIKTSWGAYPSGERNIWSLQQIYQKMWELYEGRITDGKFDASLMRQALKDFDHVFSTIPLGVLFNDATTVQESVWIRKDHGGLIDKRLKDDHLIIYNGNPETAWYRMSRIFGEISTEYPGRAFNNLAGAVKITKPVKTLHFNNPEPDRIHLFGRYGKWQKGVLVDDAYREAFELAGRL